MNFRLATLLRAFVVVFAASAMMSASASADIIATSCGATLKTTVKSLTNSSFVTSSTSFVNVPGTKMVVNVPAGQTQCVKVRFSASASCAALNANDHCYIKVIESSIIAFDPGSTFASQPLMASQSFEWAARLAAGSHTIIVQAATGGGTFTLLNWTLAVEVAK